MNNSMFSNIRLSLRHTSEAVVVGRISDTRNIPLFTIISLITRQFRLTCNTLFVLKCRLVVASSSKLMLQTYRIAELLSHRILYLKQVRCYHHC